MANETTSTTLTSQVHTEAIAEYAIAASLPKTVLLNLCNFDSIDGLQTATRQYHVDSDLGAAGSATEGTAISNTAASKGTAITGTPTEVGVVFEITEKATRRSRGITQSAVLAAFQSENVDQVVAMLGPVAARQVPMLAEAAEDACCNLMSGGSNTVGSTGVDLTLTVLLNSLYTHDTLEFNGNNPARALVLCPNQKLEVELELGLTSGGLGGSVWGGSADSSFFDYSFPGAGRQGSFLGVPLYTISHSLRTTMNSGADVAGCVICVGDGAIGEANALQGAFSFIEGAPMAWRVTQDGPGRSMELTGTYEFVAVENSDNAIVTIVSDAP